jgi:membrane protein YdbS with pleckstrin-like domain
MGVGMSEEQIIWTPLEPGQLRVMRVGGAIRGLFLLAFALGAAWIGYEAADPAFAPLIVPILALILFGIFWLSIISPPRRFRRWGYVRQGDELHVKHGVMTHTETSVSFHRVQHIDVAQGPLERMCGVTRLVLNTAGTAHSQISLPGLTRETAEALRDEIRAHIRADLA